jgi:lipopolysaccharide transport system permease protein
MYATPIVYPLSFAPAKYKLLLELNPMTAIVEAFRYGFLGQGTFTAASLGYSAIASIVILFAGIIIFNKTEKNFVDTI